MKEPTRERIKKFSTYKDYLKFIDMINPKSHYETNCDKSKGVFQVKVYDIPKKK